MEDAHESSLQRLQNFFGRNPEVAILALLMTLYLFLANYFSVSSSLGAGLYVSGGSDPYYNFRLISTFIQDHHWIYYDYSLNYPIGALNPRPPFFHLFIVFIAEMLAPFMGGALYPAKLTFLEFDAVFGALLIIPVYLIAAEVFGKKTGAIAAILYTLMPSNLSSGVLSDGRMHTPELIFAFFTIYFFGKAINTMSKDFLGPSLREIRKMPSALMAYLANNRLGLIYGALSGASMGGLMLSWQGYAYIEAIVLIYAFVQIIVNIFMKRSFVYINVLTILYVSISFLMSLYYYDGVSTGFANYWYYPALYLGLGVILFGLFMSLLSGRPWLLSLPSFAIVFLAIIGAAEVFKPALLQSLLSGEGYFIKSRVYATIAEAAAPQLGQYISGFGAAQFILGMGGVAYLAYQFMRQRKDTQTYLLVFSLVSIYMSFAAARFNVTAAPAYAILGAALLSYFIGILQVDKQLSKRDTTRTGFRKLKGGHNWITALFSISIVVLLVIPSGFETVTSGVPANSANPINQQIYNDLPSFLKPANYSSSNPQFAGASGFFITNSTTPLSRAFSWLSTQDTNVPMNQRPAYVSWWDYGFQEMSQGHHPSVADDFQQGYEVAGQVLLAQNQSQDISLFAARVLEGAYVHSGSSYNQTIMNALSQYLGWKEASNISRIAANPLGFSNLISENPAEYGPFISSISSENAYFALVAGQLSYMYPTSTIVNLYTLLERITGYNIKYVGIDHSLIPLSGGNPGIFYAPTYLTDRPSYTSNGEVVPYNYYQITATVANGSTYSLNQLPNGAVPVNYNINYKPDFYNTSIYRFFFGYSPYDTGNTSGIPGLTFGQGTYSIMPAHNMSHFEILYMGIPWNPYTNYQNHTGAWQIIPLQQAYYYHTKNIGTTYIFPPTDQIVSGSDTIVGYYPGATVTGRVTLPNGQPDGGIYATLFDQYGIPHDTVATNANGYYNLTAVPGNDTLLFSTGKYNKVFDAGTTSLQYSKVYVSQAQAERTSLGVNSTDGLPNYFIVKNFQLRSTKVSGAVEFQFQAAPYQKGEKVAPDFTRTIDSGSVTFYNASNDVSFSVPIVGGSYNFANLPLYNYSVNITTGGSTYSGINNILVSNGLTLNQNLIIEKNSIFVSAQLGAKSLPDVRVALQGPSGTAYNVTNATGFANFWVNPGTYGIYLSDKGLVSGIQQATFAAWNLNETVNLTPLPTATVSGIIGGISSPTGIQFFQNGVTGTSWNTTTTSNGSFAISLPLGVYTLYAVRGSSVALDSFILNSSTYISMSLSQGVFVNLTAGVPGNGTFSGYYEIIGSDGWLQDYYLSPYSQTSILIPKGTYTVESQGVSVGVVYSRTKVISIYSSISMNMTMNLNANLSVSVYSSTSGGTSLLDSGVIEVWGGGTMYSFQRVPASGTVALYYPSSISSGLRAVYVSPYFYTSSASVSSPAIAVHASLRTYQISADLLIGDGIANYTGNARLSGTSNYSIPMTDGTFSGSVSPGIYTLAFSSSEAYLDPTPALITVQGANESTNIQVSVDISVSVNGATNITLFNATGTRFSKAEPVPIGNYTVYASGPSGSAIKELSLNKNATLSLPFGTSYSVQFTNSKSIQSGNYYLNYGNARLNLTGGSYSLPGGSYSVLFQFLESNRSGDFKILGTTLFSVSGAERINVSVAANKFIDYMDGYALNGLAVVPYTNVTVLNSSGLYVNSTIANASGWYSVGVMSGSYSIYAINPSAGTIFTGTDQISAFSGTNPLNLTMSQGTVAGIAVSVGTKLINTDVTIIRGNFKMMVNSSVGSIFLGLQSYGFSASESYNATYDGVNFTTTYQSDITAVVSYGTYITLGLQRNYGYAFDLGQLAGPKSSVLPGSEANFTFYLNNTGKSFANVTFSSGNGSWGMVFNKTTSKSMSPGKNITVNVTVNISRYAPAGKDSIPVTVNYGIDNYTGDLSVNVVQVYNFTLTTINTVGEPHQKDIYVQFQVGNTGNGKETVNLSANKSLYTGWNLSFSYNNITESKLTLIMNQTATVYLVLSPNGTSQSTPPSVTVYATLQNSTKSLHLTPQYPNIPVLTTYPTGNSVIANYSGNPEMTLFIGIIITIGSVVGGLVVASIRGRKK